MFSSRVVAIKKIALAAPTIAKDTYICTLKQSFMSDNRLKIGITQGDANGVGWEIILKTFSDTAMTELCTPVVYGTKHIADFYASRLKDIEPVQFNICESVADVKRGRVNFIECGKADTHVDMGRETIDGAAVAIAALERAAADLRDGNIDAVVTAPINKEAMQKAGFGFTGHTEYFASVLGGEPTMIMCSDLLRVALMTVHIPVEQVAQSLSKEKIVESLKALRLTLKRDFGVVEPRIAVLALNPHAGDGGLLGSQEDTIIKPAVAEACEAGVLAFGPLAADGLFASGAYRKYDAVLAMYHDQGLAPFKTLSPDGVNFTAGLAKVRTSPDHGVAYDIAGKGIADAQSMRNAVYAAIDIVRHREAYDVWSRNPLQRFERDKGRDVSAKDLPETEPEE